MKNRYGFLSIVFTLFFTLLALMFLVMGCSETTSPEDDDGEHIDTKPPELSSVTAINGTEIRAVFNEKVNAATSEYANHYDIYRFDNGTNNSAGMPQNTKVEGDTLQIYSVALHPDEKTVQITILMMNDGDSYHFIANNIKDINGNTMDEPDTIDFVGIDTPDETTPEILYFSPAAGANGVGICQSVEVHFSEMMEEMSVREAFEWTGPSGNVPYDMESWGYNSKFSFVQNSPLENNKQYTIRFKANTAMDCSSNYLPEINWIFTTTDVADNTPPTIISSVPADGETNVPLDVTLQFNFSEPIDPNSDEEDTGSMTPDPGDGIRTWSNGGKTLEFKPDNPLLENTKYMVSFTEAAWKDYAGNPLSEIYKVTFTTGAAWPTGEFSGTITGDPNSEAATDPTGAWVIVWMDNIATWDEEGEPPIGGEGIADQYGIYSVQYLEDHVYYPTALLDSDGDGVWSFSWGDALGIYGIDFETNFDLNEIDSVTISGGDTVTDVNIKLWDPSAIWGYVTYGGTLYENNPWDYVCHIALYDTTGFDINTSIPSFEIDDWNANTSSRFCFNELNHNLEDGTYYVISYMDIDSDDGDGYNPLVDPVGFYGDGGVMTHITIESGRDFGDILIIIQDPQ